MAEKSIIISAEEEAILLKPIDEYVGKIRLFLRDPCNAALSGRLFI